MTRRREGERELLLIVVPDGGGGWRCISPAVSSRVAFEGKKASATAQTLIDHGEQFTNSARDPALCVMRRGRLRKDRGSGKPHTRAYLLQRYIEPMDVQAEWRLIP